MVSIKMDMRSVKRNFLDRQAVMNRFDKMAIRSLGRMGALTRTLSRRSMRKGGQQARPSQFGPELRKLIGKTSISDISIEPWPRIGSEPGKPPRYRTRRLRDNIYFVATPKKRSVVIGPQVSGREDVPGLLEFGGISREPAKRWVAFWEGGKKKIRLANGNGGRIPLKPRPYMAPAYETALDKLVPSMYRNAFK